MKNIPFPDIGQDCPICKINIFALITPNGADFTTCPICGDYNTLDPSDLEGYYYCLSCKILYDGGCIHSYNGSNDNIFYGRLIESYQYDNIKYIGMPQFESLDECKNILQNIIKEIISFPINDGFVFTVY